MASTSYAMRLKSKVGKGLRPSPFLPPVIKANTLLSGFIHVIQLKFSNDPAHRKPGPILKIRMRYRRGLKQMPDKISSAKHPEISKLREFDASDTEFAVVQPFV